MESPIIIAPLEVVKFSGEPRHRFLAEKPPTGFEELGIESSVSCTHLVVFAFADIATIKTTRSNAGLPRRPGTPKGREIFPMRHEIIEPPIQRQIHPLVVPFWPLHPGAWIFLA